MKTRSVWMLGWLVPLALGACAANRPKPATAGKPTPQMRSGSQEARTTYQVGGWIAPDDRTLIVNAADRSLYQGHFKGRCTGLRLVDTIAFIVQTPPQLEKYEGIVLPDGTRCVFTSFTRLLTATEPASDSVPTEKP